MRRCIICKHNSENSKSVEHIIPESLGNKNIVLPKGVVCDKCNNYIGRKIEEPFLNDPYIMEIRFKSRILNKKKKSPIIKGFHLQSSKQIGISFDVYDHSLNICAIKENEEERWLNSLSNMDSGTLIMPINLKPDPYKMSRFLAKVAIEALAEKVLEVPGGIDECIDKKELDGLRAYIRKGSSNIWPYAERKIYPVYNKTKDVNVNFRIFINVLRCWG